MIILNQAELSSDGHDEKKGDGDVEPLHAAVRFSFRSSMRSDIYLASYIMMLLLADKFIKRW
jgi:hypothetical protein